MTMTYFTIIFITLLLLHTLTKVYLSVRQIRFVSLHREKVPSAFAQKISLLSHQRASDYTIANQRFHLINIFIDVIVLLGFTLFGGLTWLNTLITEYISSPIWYQIVLVLAVSFIGQLIHLPFSLYRTFVLEQSFGFNRMTPKLFLLDTIKSTIVSLIIMLPLLYIGFTLAESYLYSADGFSVTWWKFALVAGSFFIVVMLLMMLIVPTVIMPLFNKFTPLDHPELQERIQALAQRANFALKALFVMDGSKRSAHGNAFFTGFGKSRRIVFFDTLLEKLSPVEIEAVLAHELGHFKHKHIIKRLGVTFVMVFLFFGVLAYLLDKTWFYAGLGVFPDIGQPPLGIAVVLFSLVLPVFTFWYTPISRYLSRRDEFEADHYAAQQSDAQALISALVKLYDDNASTLTPDPVYSAFYDSHPPASIRIQHLNSLP